jgi:hypothetical protein
MEEKDESITTRVKLDPPAEAPVETPTEPVVEPTKEPVREPTTEPEPTPPNPDDLIRERLGLTVEQIENLKTEYESLKGKPVVDDPELIPDDDFLKNFVKTYKRNGDVTAYLEAMTTDYDKMSAEQIVKYEVRKANPGLSDRLIQRKVNDYMRQNFGFQDEFESEEDEADFQELLRVYADQKKAELKENQKKFQIPERKEQVVEDDGAVERFTQFVEDHPTTKSVADGKKVAFGDFNFQVDPQELKEAAIDSSKFFTLFSNERGEIDLDKYYKVTAFAKDPNTFLKAYTAHELAKAKIEWLRELKNPSVEASDKPKTGEVKIRLV